MSLKSRPAKLNAFIGKIRLAPFEMQLRIVVGIVRIGMPSIVGGLFGGLQNQVFAKQDKRLILGIMLHSRIQHPKRILPAMLALIDLGKLQIG